MSVGEESHYTWKDAAGNVVADGVEHFGTGPGSFSRTLAVGCAGASTVPECHVTFGETRSCFCINTFGMDGCGVNAQPNPTATCTTGACS